MKWDTKIEPAEQYFLVPIQSPESLFFIGDRKALEALQEVMPEDKIVATAGRTHDGCYILVNGDNDYCTKMQDKVARKLKKS